MGKGSKRRPTHVDEETFARRWERTFGGAGWGDADPHDGRSLEEAAVDVMRDMYPEEKEGE